MPCLTSLLASASPRFTSLLMTHAPRLTSLLTTGAPRSAPFSVPDRTLLERLVLERLVLERPAVPKPQPLTSLARWSAEQSPTRRPLREISFSLMLETSEIDNPRAIRGS